MERRGASVPRALVGKLRDCVGVFHTGRTWDGGKMGPEAFVPLQCSTPCPRHYPSVKGAEEGPEKGGSEKGERVKRFLRTGK